MNDDIDNQEEENEKTPPPEGWIQIPILRGIFEIQPLLDLCDRHGGYVIGGYARFCCSTADRLVKAGDVDIFPVGADEAESQRVYDGWFKALTDAGLKVKHENNVSLTYEKPEAEPFNRCPTIQLIKPIEEGAIVTRGTVEEILSNFDFTVVRVAINRDRQTATAWASFPKDEKHRKLRILNIHCPISSLLRVMKYGRKGYYMRPVEALKLFVDWERRTPEYRQGISNAFEKSQFGKLSQTEIDELEALLRVD